MEMPMHKEFIRSHRACTESASTLACFLSQTEILHFSWFLFSFRVESKAKDDFKFPVMVEDGKHSCTEVYSLHPTKSGACQRKSNVKERPKLGALVVCLLPPKN